MSQHIAVVIGVGGMGQAIARRVGPGARLLLADFNEETLDTVTGQLRGEGYEVTSQAVDVSSRASVAALAKRAASLGEVRYVVHTAGLSPAQAPVPAILAVDLRGVALVAEEFGEVVASGGAGVVIASMAAHNYPPFPPEQARELATTPADRLLDLPIADPANFPHAGAAYAFAKRANLVRVQAASVTWGAKGARINAISPGHIATPMGHTELGGEHGAIIQAMIDGSNAKHEGTAADIARAAEFLLSPGAGFISGSDLLVDGGVIAALQTGHITLR
ncbi:SDR family oxidoreductase [Streptomyces sp. NPDC059568]|uniref:SDR family oxidoreductase n=1 Tax=Streptomyces sp. NPDC059568 TaxID=3346868 RepID=UPI003688A512